MSDPRELGKKVTDLFRQYQTAESFNPAAEYDRSQIAIANLAQAFHGVISDEDLMSAVGNAESVNGVSRAARHRLPPLP